MGAAGLLQVMSMYRRLVVVMLVQSCGRRRGLCGSFARIVGVAVRMEVLWAVASSWSEGKLMSSVGGRTRGSLGKTERMEV